MWKAGRAGNKPPRPEFLISRFTDAGQGNLGLRKSGPSPSAFSSFPAFPIAGLLNVESWKGWKQTAAPCGADSQIHPIQAEIIWDSGNQAQAPVSFPPFPLSTFQAFKMWNLGSKPPWAVPVFPIPGG
jgi:hypothetical protein